MISACKFHGVMREPQIYLEWEKQQYHSIHVNALTIALLHLCTKILYHLLIRWQEHL